MFPEMMGRAASNLKNSNMRSLHRDKVPENTQNPQQSVSQKLNQGQLIGIEDQPFEVIRDPKDGNYYLHIDPLDFEKYSAEDLKKLQESYAEDVAEQMMSAKEQVVEQPYKKPSEQQQTMIDIDYEVISPENDDINSNKK